MSAVPSAVSCGLSQVSVMEKMNLSRGEVIECRNVCLCACVKPAED